jgi:hypothetical protein
MSVKTTRVGIYARFSSDRQNERSIDDQVVALQGLLDVLPCRQFAPIGWDVTQ